MLEVIEAIELFRISRGWTKRQMAHELGLQNSHYSEFTSGSRGLPSRALKRAYTLGISAEVLLKPELDEAV